MGSGGLVVCCTAISSVLFTLSVAVFVPELGTTLPSITYRENET